MAFSDAGEIGFGASDETFRGENWSLFFQPIFDETAQKRLFFIGNEVIDAQSAIRIAEK